MTFPYRSLFLFEAEQAAIFEIKRLDVQSQNPGDVYFWLYFDTASGQLSQLEFVAMRAEVEEHQRDFRQGRLQFNATEATFSPADGSPPLALRTVTPPVLPAALEEALFALFA